MKNCTVGMTETTQTSINTKKTGTSQPAWSQVAQPGSTLVDSFPLRFRIRQGLKVDKYQSKSTSFDWMYYNNLLDCRVRRRLKMLNVFGNYNKTNNKQENYLTFIL